MKMYTNKKCIQFIRDAQHRAKRSVLHTVCYKNKKSQQQIPYICASKRNFQRILNKISVECFVVENAHKFFIYPKI